MRKCRNRSAGFGSFDKVFNVLEEVLSSTPYLLGEKFSAADVLIAADLHFTINAFKMLEPRPVFASYLERCQSRPAFLSRGENQFRWRLTGASCSASSPAFSAGPGAAGSMLRATRGRWPSPSRPACRTCCRACWRGGASTPETALGHLDPTLRALLPEPFSLTAMREATERLVRAVEKQETIAIFGDYDVDGACSSALLAEFLDFCGVPRLIHIPDRITEGYGPNRGSRSGRFPRGAPLCW